MIAIRRIKPSRCETKREGGGLEEEENGKIWNKMKIRKVNGPIFGSILTTSPIQMVKTLKPSIAENSRLV